MQKQKLHTDWPVLALTVGAGLAAIMACNAIGFLLHFPNYVLSYLFILTTSIAVYMDAQQRGISKATPLEGMGPGGWFLMSLLLWILVLPIYMARRGNFSYK